MSPIRSPTLVSGVASFSPYRSLRCRQPTGSVVAELGVQPPAARAHRRLRVVVDLAAVDDGRPLVEQRHQGADQPGLALAALAEQHHVVARRAGRAPAPAARSRRSRRCPAKRGAAGPQQLATRLSRISCLTDCGACPVARSSPRVLGRCMVPTVRPAAAESQSRSGRHARCAITPDTRRTGVSAHIRWSGWGSDGVRCGDGLGERRRPAGRGRAGRRGRRCRRWAARRRTWPRSSPAAPDPDHAEAALTAGRRADRRAHRASAATRRASSAAAGRSSSRSAVSVLVAALPGRDLRSFHLEVLRDVGVDRRRRPAAAAAGRRRGAAARRPLLVPRRRVRRAVGRGRCPACRSAAGSRPGRSGAGSTRLLRRRPGARPRRRRA